jgi:regulator of protease activity HflC (stomatin/prohibitin superfamily)
MERKLNLSRVLGTGFVGLLIVIVPIVIITGLSAWNPVKYGTVEAVTQYGALTGEVFTEGANWKTPFIQGTRTINIQTLNYETSNFPEDSNADFTDFPVGTNTHDGQTLDITYTVLFHIPPENALQILRTWGNMDRVVERVVKTLSRAEVRELAKGFEAEQLFTAVGVDAFEADVTDALEVLFNNYGVSLAVEGFQVRSFGFDEEYVQTIENQQIAQEKIETARFDSEAAEFEKQQAIRAAEAVKQDTILQAEAAAERTLLNANAKAEARVLEAGAEAEAIRLEGAASAFAIEAQGEALRAYAEMLQWEFLSEWNGAMPRILMGDNDIMTLLPLEDLGQ